MSSEPGTPSMKVVSLLICYFLLAFNLIFKAYYKESSELCSKHLVKKIFVLVLVQTAIGN